MKTVVVDADGLIALFSKDDAHAEKAILLLQELAREEAKILYPSTALVEAATTLQRKLHQPQLAAQIADLVKESQFPIESVSEQTLSDAVAYSCCDTHQIG
jgi:predicted nucleic acid-binding protein